MTDTKKPEGIKDVLGDAAAARILELQQSEKRQDARTVAEIAAHLKLSNTFKLADTKAAVAVAIELLAEAREQLK